MDVFVFDQAARVAVAPVIASFPVMLHTPLPYDIPSLVSSLSPTSKRRQKRVNFEQKGVLIQDNED